MIALAFLAAVALVVTGGLLLHLERKDARHAAAVQYLLQRIQDPVAAVAQHAVETQPQPIAHLPFDDDEAYLTYVETLEQTA